MKKTVYQELGNSGDPLHHFKVENPKKWPSIWINVSSIVIAQSRGLDLLNGHKLNPLFNEVNKMLSAGPTHLSNLAKILLLQHFLKMDPPTTAFVPRPVTTAQGIYSNLKSNLLFGCILGISCKELITKKLQLNILPSFS